MVKGFSLHIGLNQVDPAEYNGWHGKLFGCINDARAMKKLADNIGYNSTLITDQEATSNQVIKFIGQSSEQLKKGDIFLLTYAGHGAQVPDFNNDELEDNLDETWVLWDRMLLDDELFQLWRQFKPGVRIVVVSDSCHSGTIVRNYPQVNRFYKEILASIEVMGFRNTNWANAAKPRLIPESIQKFSFQKHRKLYESLSQLSRNNGSELVASLLMLSACQDNQLAADGQGNGVFTRTLLDVWDQGQFFEGYEEFHSKILTAMPPWQTPNLLKLGRDNPSFYKSSPFSITINPSTKTPDIPTIHGPSEYSANGASPVFKVNPGKDRHFAVEATINPDLFNYESHHSKRTPDNFFASWDKREKCADAGIILEFSSTYPTDYRIPEEVWKRLTGSREKIYYRIWSNSTGNEWRDPICSLSEEQYRLAPFISLKKKPPTTDELTFRSAPKPVKKRKRLKYERKSKYV